MFRGDDGGVLNALAIAWLDLPPLIVTLGTYSLFRGLAEGLTGGVQYFSGFPPSFLAFGSGGQIAILALAIALFSLAAMPLFAGFFTKFILFQAGVQEGLLWLVGIALVNSFISLYYYLLVLKQIYVVPPRDTSRLQIPILPLVALGLMATAVLVLGCAPDLVVSKLLAALGT